MSSYKSAIQNKWNYLKGKFKNIWKAHIHLRNEINKFTSSLILNEQSSSNTKDSVDLWRICEILNVLHKNRNYYEKNINDCYKNNWKYWVETRSLLCYRNMYFIGLLTIIWNLFIRHVSRFYLKEATGSKWNEKSKNLMRFYWITIKVVVKNVNPLNVG